MSSYGCSGGPSCSCWGCTSRFLATRSRFACAATRRVSASTSCGPWSGADEEHEDKNTCSKHGQSDANEHVHGNQRVDHIDDMKNTQIWIGECAGRVRIVLYEVVPIFPARALVRLHTQPCRCLGFPLSAEHFVWWLARFAPAAFVRSSARSHKLGRVCG